MELEKKPHEICAQNELQDLSPYFPKAYAFGIHYYTSCGGYYIIEQSLLFSPRRGRHVVAPCASMGIMNNQI